MLRDQIAADQKLIGELRARIEHTREMCRKRFEADTQTMRESILRLQKRCRDAGLRDD